MMPNLVGFGILYIKEEKDMRCKRIVSLLLTLAMVIGVFSMPVFAAEDEIKVLLDGQELVFDVPPQLINDRTMVPMRKIFESMGASVEWEDSTQTVTATRGDITVIMQIDNNVIKVSGKDITLDVPPQLVDSRTLVPARAVAESLNAKVDWDNDTQTVIITSESEVASPIIPIDLNKETDFICNVGATITYGFDDIWNKTVGTEYMPIVKVVDSAYRGQYVLMSPLYANFTIDDTGYAKVTYSLKRKMPNGKEEYLIKDVVAIDGKTMPKQIIKSMSSIEYIIEETDPLGVYTFIVESKDVVGNKETKNVFTVDFKEYKYVKNEFKSTTELTEFVCNYAINPNPDRIIDAVIYAEKQGLITYPILFTGLVEMYAKNPYIVEEAVAAFEKEFGEGGTETLLLLDNSAAQYLENILSSNPPTMTRVAVTDDINGNIMMYGSAIGAYYTGASYDAAKVLIQSLEKKQFSDKEMEEYGVPSIKIIIENDPLFKAYCEYMLNIDTTLNSKTKQILSTLLK